jgi:hypothetical protein
MPTDIEEKYGHQCGRKLDRFGYADRFDPIVVDRADVDQLEQYSSTDLGIRTPMDELSFPDDNKPVVFLITHRGRMYMVNTEEYDYCRYVLPVVIKESQS